MAARLEAGELLVMIPATFTDHQEREWVERMTARVLRRAGRGRADSEEALAERGRLLSSRYLGNRAVPVSVRWVDNQVTRWGSTTPSLRTIRLSRALAPMPSYVIDYVLLHELAHLIEPGHGPDFWALLQGYPQLERARGYLDGYAAARGWPADGEPSDVEPDTTSDVRDA